MGYTRVIPRDLFNEANLLKCIGGLYIALEHVESRAPTGCRDADASTYRRRSLVYGPCLEKFKEIHNLTLDS
jgi:hypothetical protein